MKEDILEYTLNQLAYIVDMSPSGRMDVKFNLKELISKVLEEAKGETEKLTKTLIDTKLPCDKNYNQAITDVLELLDTIIKKYK